MCLCMDSVKSVTITRAWHNVLNKAIPQTDETHYEDVEITRKDLEEILGCSSCGLWCTDESISDNSDPGYTILSNSKIIEAKQCSTYL